MPLPLIPIIIGGAAALAGIFETIKAGVDGKKAKDINASANRVYSNAKDSLELSRKASYSALEALGEKKLYMLDKSISRFITSFEKLKNVQLKDSAGLNELNKFSLDKQSINELKEMGGFASSILGGAAAGALGGALAAFGAYSGVMMFGAASTGTAIAALSGAAATNATLAFLGGGALAAGGLGMAGGMVVLGGLVAGPALAIFGFIADAKAKAELDKAKSNLAEAKKIEAELNTAAVLCNGIRRRSYMFYRLLICLDALFFPLIFGMEKIISKKKGNDWNNFGKKEKNTIAASASIAKAIKTILDTPILTEKGELTEESAQVAKEIGKVIEAYEMPEVNEIFPTAVKSSNPVLVMIEKLLKLIGCRKCYAGYWVRGTR